ncbi:MAG: peptide ligase PGM1-related protein [Acidimicrobiia bacterium]
MTQVEAGAPSIAALQQRLGAAWEANRIGSRVHHVMVVLPSYSLAETLLEHYGERIAPLEHRYLVASLSLPRYPNCEMVFVTCQDPGPEVLDHYFGLLPAEERDQARRRFRLLVVDDPTPRAVAPKLLERADLLRELQSSIGDRLAYIEPWNVGHDEVQLALALGLPLYGTPAELWPLGYKSAGRRLLVEAGVTVPFGVEDVRSVEQAVAAAETIRRHRPRASALVIKHDDSGGGDGNQLIDLAGLDPEPASARAVIRSRIQALPHWYLENLGAGAVVEERIEGEAFASPSVQITIEPSGEIAVFSAHEQVLGGKAGQTYSGCRFPADPSYAAELGRHGVAVGEVLRDHGVLGRVGIDFVATRGPEGWSLHGLEINLRKGGTTHPFAVLRHLVRGNYDPGTGTLREPGGPAKYYSASDNMVDPAWTVLTPAAVIKAVDGAGLTYDRARGTGVVLHMLSCLAIDGRFGLTAIGDSPEQAADLYEATGAVVNALTA